MKRATAALTAALIFSAASSGGAAYARDGAVIRNGGSTNFSGYTIKVWSDGSASAVRSGRNGTPEGAATTASIPGNLAQTFLNDARQARSNHAISRACMKSASFGTTTVVLYHGWTSPDLECPGGGFSVALAADAHKIAAVLNVQAMRPKRNSL